MKIFIPVFILLFTFATNPNLAFSSPEDEILELVKSLGANPNIQDNLPVIKKLSQHPQDAVAFLIKELQVIPKQVIRREELHLHSKSMHVIWCIRALRYIANGLNITGKTAQRPNDSVHSYLWQFVTGKDNNELPFFVVWMSRDIIYLAPPDAQMDIINKWKEWYLANGKTFDYKPAESIDDWYF